MTGPSDPIVEAMIRDGLRLGSDPASPCIEHENPPQQRDIRVIAHLGLTKREYFAGLAMQGMCGAIANELNDEHLSVFASACVRMADALLQELAR